MDKGPDASVEVDHVFICASVGAQSADLLNRLGLEEGSPNVHPGQGTACRRFFFRNTMLELLWVADELEARSAETRRTQLWERWAGSPDRYSPFGIVLRPKVPEVNRPPFAAWEYHPARMPGLVLQIASDTVAGEPMWCFAASGKRQDAAPSGMLQPMDHKAGLRELTRIRLYSPRVEAASVTASMSRRGVIDWAEKPRHRIELEFDDRRQGRRTDLTPHLPLALLW